MISNIRNCDVTLMPFFSIDMFHRIVPQYSILDSFFTDSKYYVFGIKVYFIDLENKKD